MEEMTVAEVMKLWQEHDQKQPEMTSARHNFIPYTVGTRIFQYNSAQPTSTVQVLFDQFCAANTFQQIIKTFQHVCDEVNLAPGGGIAFYKNLRNRVTSWRAKALWTKLDKRASHPNYKKGQAAANTTVLIVGGGPCGLRTAIETLLLGAKVVVLEKRDRFSRNNVLHLWPFVINDLKALGAKKFFGKFCAGSIDHISIRTLQCVLLKVALIFGVEIHPSVTFNDLVEPVNSKEGWRADVTPSSHHVTKLHFDVLVGADGSRNTVKGFEKKEFRGKLAVAITANFINRNTSSEAHAPEIGGVAFIFNQKFFRDLYARSGIDLENIVYYKDETHYFVMTAKKHSLLAKGVLIHDYDDPGKLLHKENVCEEALVDYAREAATVSTDGQLEPLEFAHNRYGRADVSIFDFTSMYQAVHASKVRERQGHKMLMCLVGDSLLEPFWPTGSGCPRGFLGAMDTAWMIKNWASQKMTPLEVIAERESVYQLLSQTTAENLFKTYNNYSIDPSTRYPNLDLNFFKPNQIQQYYDGTDTKYLNQIVKMAEEKSKLYEMEQKYKYLLKWLQRNVNGYRSDILVKDLLTSWKDGLALSAFVHKYKPELIKFEELSRDSVERNWEISTKIIEKELNVLWPYDDCYTPCLDGKFPKYLLDIFDTVMKQGLQPAKIRRANVEGDRNFQSFKKTNNSDSEEEHSIEIKKRDDVDKKRTEDLKRLREGMPPVGTRGQNKVSKLATNLMHQWGYGSVDVVDEITNSGKNEFTVSVTSPDICYFCNEPVYLVEKMRVEDVYFHRSCFKCYYCGSSLRVGQYNYKSVNEKLRFYCPQHMNLEREMKRKRSMSEIASPQRSLNSDLAERVEYDLESECEESEWDQVSHNLSLIPDAGVDLGDFESDDDDDDDDGSIEDDQILSVDPLRSGDIEFLVDIKCRRKNKKAQEIIVESDSSGTEKVETDSEDDKSSGTPSPNVETIDTTHIQRESLVSSTFKSSRMAFFNTAPVPVKIDHGSLASRLNLPKLSVEIERERLQRLEEERLRREEEARLKEEEERLRQEEEERIKREKEEQLRREAEERLKREEADRLMREEEERLKREEKEQFEKRQKEYQLIKEEEERIKTEEERIKIEQERLKEIEESLKSKELFLEENTSEEYQENNTLDDTLKLDEESPASVSEVEKFKQMEKLIEDSYQTGSESSSTDSRTPPPNKTSEEDMIKLLINSQSSKLPNLSSSSCEDSEDNISSTNGSMNDSEDMHSSAITIKGVTLDSTSDNVAENVETIRNSISSNDDFENTLDDASDISQSRETVSTTSPILSSGEESAFGSSERKKCHLANFSEFSSLSSLDSSTPAKTPSTPGKRMFVEIPTASKPSPWHSKALQNQSENDTKKENSRSRSVDYSTIVRKSEKILPKSLSIQEITSKDEESPEIPLFSPIVKKMTPSYIKDEDGDRNNNGNDLVAVLVDEGTTSERTILIDDSKVTKTRGRTPRRHTAEPKFLSSDNCKKQLFDIEKEENKAKEFENPVQKVEPVVVEITELRFIKQNEAAKFMPSKKFERAEFVPQKREAQRRPITIENVRVLLDNTRPKSIFRGAKINDDEKSKREALQRTKSDQSSKLFLRSQSESSSGSDRIKLQAAELEKKFSYKSQMKSFGEEYPIKKPVKKSSRIENLQKQITQLELSSGVKAYSKATERDVVLRGRLLNDEKRDSPSRGSESQSEDSSSKEFFGEEIPRTDSSASKASSTSLKSDENDNKISNAENAEKPAEKVYQYHPPVDEKRSEKLIRHLDAKRRFVSQDPEPIRIDPNAVFGFRSKSEDHEKHEVAVEVNGNEKNTSSSDKKSFPWTPKNKSLDTSLSSASSYGSSDRDQPIDTSDPEKPPPKPPRRPNSADEKQKRRSLLRIFKKHSDESSKTKLEQAISSDRSKSSKLKRRSKNEQKKLTEEILNSIPPSSSISPPMIDRKILERLTKKSNLTNVPTASEECLECGSEEEEEERQMTAAEKEEKVRKMEQHLGKQQKKLEQRQLREAQQLQRNLQEVEEMQRSVEKRGVEVESKLRNKDCVLLKMIKYCQWIR